MVCNPSDNTINPPSLGAGPDIGFGPAFAPTQIPFPDINLPNGIPEDIIELLNNITAIIPGGTLSPNADDAFRTVFSAIASLLNQLGPYLALYNFFQALLEMILCIIDVICALLNPFATISAVIRLFKRCIPNFLSLFPFIALIAMILAFLILLITLIEFLINYIIAIINDLINNIERLGEAFQVGDEQGVLAITQKLASLICLIEQAFALLIAFQALFVIIEALLALAGRAPCRQGKDPCCTDEFCPPFIAESSDGVSGTFGRLIYHRQVSQNLSALGLPTSLQVGSLREERWQFVDDSPGDFIFKDIITSINGNTFWPEPNEFSKGDNLTTTVPYTLDLNFNLDPSVFNNNIAINTARDFVIKDVIVTVKPYIGVLAHNNNLDFGISAPAPLTGTAFGNYNGTFDLIGGLVYESNGITPVFDNSGNQLTLDTLINLNSSFSIVLPGSEDGYQISNINYTWNINHKVLFKYQLISSGCVPEVATESAVIDATFDTAAVADKIGSLPDVTNSLNCLNNAINTFRQDVSIESAAVFQDSVVSCLNDLKEEAESVFSRAFQAGASPYESDFSLEPDVQFVGEPIVVSVNVKDQGDNEIGNNIPGNISDEISEILKGEVTFGEITDFTYDGYKLFTAEITSDEVGTGDVRVMLNDAFISDILNRDNENIATEIEIKTVPYQFVGGFSTGERDSVERRNETDVANSE